jgi:hypothetical protein
MTGILPVSGAGARISGSTPVGGHSTPSDFASLSPSGSLDWPTVGGAPVLPRAIGWQFVEDCDGGGAVCSGGVVGVGGACATTSTGVMSTSPSRNIEQFVGIPHKPTPSFPVPQRAGLFVIKQTVHMPRFELIVGSIVAARPNRADRCNPRHGKNDRIARRPGCCIERLASRKEALCPRRIRRAPVPVQP